MTGAAVHPHVDYQSDAQSIWAVLQEASGTLAFDIGANGGLVACSLAERFETVIACEPAVESYAHLVETASPNVTPLNVAVSAQAGTITLRETALTGILGELFTGDSLPWGDHVGYREVAACTLDGLAVIYGTPDFIKVDTEGHESQVLAGGMGVLATHPNFVIEIHSQENGAAVRHALNAVNLPYDMHHHNAYRTDSAWRRHHYWLVG